MKLYADAYSKLLHRLRSHYRDQVLRFLSTMITQNSLETIKFVLIQKHTSVRYGSWFWKPTANNNEIKNVSIEKCKVYYTAYNVNSLLNKIVQLEYYLNLIVSTENGCVLVYVYLCSAKLEYNQEVSTNYISVSSNCYLFIWDYEVSRNE